jgi:hypothetical protein
MEQINKNTDIQIYNIKYDKCFEKHYYKSSLHTQGVYM